MLSEKIYDDLWIQPAAGDAGGSLGAALDHYYSEKENKRITNKKRFHERISSLKKSPQNQKFLILFIKSIAFMEDYTFDESLTSL